MPYIPIHASDNVGPKKHFFTVVAYLVTEISAIESIPGKMSGTNNF